MKNKFIFWLIIFTLLSGCADSASTVPIMTQTATSISASPPTLISTSTLTLQPSITPTAIFDYQKIITDATFYFSDFELGGISQVGINDWENNWEIREDISGNKKYCNLINDEWVDFTIDLGKQNNYAFEADVQLLGDNNDFHFSLFVRLSQDAGFVANIFQNQASLYANSPYTIFGEKQVYIDRGTWHKLRVEVVNDLIQYYVDQDPVAETLDNLGVEGNVGVSSAPGTEICIDNLRFWSVDESGPVARDSLGEVTGQDKTREYFKQVDLVESIEIPLLVGDSAYFIRSSVRGDMDSDGIPDAVFTITTYPENLRHPIIVLNGDGPVKNIAEEIFRGEIPSVQHSNQNFFIDINNDGLEDLLFSEAGPDHPPWYSPDAKIGIAMNLGNGKWEDVSKAVPIEAVGLRNYSLASGDLYNDGVTRIILPSQATTNGYPGPSFTGLLSWNENAFDFEQNWVNLSLWWYGQDLRSSSFMMVKDIDGDGWQDLYVSGTWTTPNHRILFGNEDFPLAQSLITLPNGPFGHTPYDVYKQSYTNFARGADVNQVVIEDFDGDGDLDILSVMEDIHQYKPGIFDDKSHSYYQDVSKNGGGVYWNTWLHVLRNDGNRQFLDVKSQGRDLGYRYYIALLPVDLDLDGDTDLIGHYWSKNDTGICVPRWGSTIFVNEGDMVFRSIDATEVFPEFFANNERISINSCQTLGLGVFFPNEITNDGISGLFVVPDDSESLKPKIRVLRFYATGKFIVP